MSENRNLDVMMAFGLGVLAGTVGALLLAPASGEETRRRLGEMANDVAGRVKEGAGTVTSAVKDQVSRVSHAVEEGKLAYQRESRGA